MSASDLKTRLSTELKQNPQQFALLGVGLVVALVVWAPRLKNVVGASDDAAVTAAVPIDDSTGAPAPATASVLDTHAMLDEFRDISNEAQEKESRSVFSPLPSAWNALPGTKAIR